MFGLPEFLAGAIVGGAVIFLFPGVGAGGNAIWKGVRAFFENL